MGIVESAGPGARQDGAIARNALSLAAGQAISTVLAVVASSLLGRGLGAAEFGLFFVVSSMAAFAYVVVEWGQSASVVRELAGRPERAPALLGAAAASRVALSVAMCLVTAAAAALLGYDARTRGLAVLAVALALPLSLAQAWGLAFRGRERMDYEATVTVAAKGLSVALIGLALAVGGGLVDVLLAQGLAGVGAFAVALWLGRRLGLARPSVDRGTLRELATEGAPVLTMAVLVAAQPYLDAVVLSKLVSPVSMGRYAAARNFMGALLTPAAILGAASYPALSRAIDDPARLTQVLRRVLRPLVAIGAFGALGTFLFAGLAVRVVFGPAYAPSADILRAFAPVLLLFFVDMLLATVIMAARRSRRLALAKLLNVALSTALCWLLVPVCEARWGNGGLGVVIAFGASEGVMLAAALLIVPAGTRGAGLLGELGRAVAAGAGALAAGWLPLRAHPAFQIPATLVAFAALSALLGLVRREDVEVLRASLRRRGPENSMNEASLG
ncbi:MAG: oligosaccharide flippase family protein [Myxococcales bacterium]